jgi:capsular polysaccharide transport system permease protein
MIKRIEQIYEDNPSFNALFKLKDVWYSILKRDIILMIAVVAAIFSAVYWLIIASDRYVSESHVIIQRTDLSGGQSVDFSTILSGAGGVSRADQLLMRDYLLSKDMLKKLDASLNLKAHFSDPQHDIFSRMWLKEPSFEQFYKYFVSRVSVELDDYAGVLVIKAEAYDPKIAHAIVAMLVSEGERYMNALAHHLAQDQVTFLEKQVAQNNERAIQARQSLLNYQNKKGLVSPQSTAENIVSLVARLEAQRTELETQRSVLQSYLVANHPNIVLLNQQIAAVAKQIAQEQGKLASPSGRTLNRTVEEYQRLEMDAAFTHDVYKTTLIALEKVKVEVARTIKKVSVLQSPTLPDYPLQPRRLYNTLVFTLFIFMMAGVASLLLAIVRDHKD